MPPVALPRGTQVYKFSPDSKLLLTLCTAGGARDSAFFFQPNAVLVAPDGTKHLYCLGRTPRRPRTPRRAVAAQVRQGRQVSDDLGQERHWSGRIRPAARARHGFERASASLAIAPTIRIQIFDQNGKLLDTWYQFSRPSGIFIDKVDKIYVADSESQSVARDRTNWKRGIRIGRARDGTVVALIPDPAETATNTSAAEEVSR